MMIDRVCEVCGKVFKIQPSRRNSARFCSMKCYATYKRQHPEEFPKPPKRGYSIEVRCEYCGKIFKVKAARHRNHRARFCSRNCYRNYRREHPEEYPSGFMGHRHSEETKRRIREVKRKQHIIPRTAFKRGEHRSPATEFKKGIIPYNKGKTLEELFGEERAKEIRRKTSESHKGQKPWHAGRGWPEWVRKKLSEVHKGKRLSSEHLRNILRANAVKPNKSELRLLGILRSIDPNWRYVGDGSLIIDGKCPDFWDGGNRLVELFGEFWHRDDDPQERIGFFASRGYDCVVVWDFELGDVERVIRKVGTLYLEKIQVKQGT